ncbi:DUF3313 domain-containing protein [Pantoea sp. B65]|uniref:DUF3313 domain-containing protein n=1 Tax=Pantoea sp. B65 TaxID=2813359 RepID=UPI0039B3EA2C
MYNTHRAFRFALLTLSLALAGCAGTQPVAWSGLSSSAQLKPDAESQHMPYRYTPVVDWKKYSAAIIEPVVIYQGADNQFGDMAQEDRQALASYMQKRFSERLASRFTPATSASAHTLKIKLTLAGAETTTPVLGTFTKFDLAGGPYNIVQSIRGKEGMLNGSVSYAVEIYDAASNQLLSAWVAKQYPNAMNVSASFGALSAAEVGIDKGADQLVEMLN